MSRSTPIISTAALAVAMLWSAPAFAQDEVSDSADGAAEASTEITVTGTRIQRDGYRAPTDVQQVWEGQTYKGVTGATTPTAVPAAPPRNSGGVAAPGFKM